MGSTKVLVRTCSCEPRRRQVSVPLRSPIPCTQGRRRESVDPRRSGMATSSFLRGTTRHCGGGRERERLKVGNTWSSPVGPLGNRDFRPRPLRFASDHSMLHRIKFRKRMEEVRASGARPAHARGATLRPRQGVYTTLDHLREGLRFPVHLPVQVRWKTRSGRLCSVKGRTGDVSGNGLFLNLSVRPRRKTPIAIRVSLPPEATSVPIDLLCWGRVVRWSLPGEVPGIAAVIDHYQLRPAQGR